MIAIVGAIRVIAHAAVHWITFDTDCAVMAGAADDVHD